ncbi:hypothetical protein GINT2_002295 [Glugoides intestinalis]
MAFQKDHYLVQLLLLRPTEEHLKALVIYLRTFDDGSETIKEGIEFVHDSSSIHHRITLYYLVNELLMAKVSEALQIALKRFIKDHFSHDITASLKHEILKKKLLELEKVWTQKKIIDFKGENALNEVLFNIKNSFFDKKRFAAVLKDLLQQCQEDEDK